MNPDSNDFLCSICLELFVPPLAICNQCGNSFHKPCIFRWIKANQQLAACPCCNAKPICVTENRALDRVFELSAEKRTRLCRYCKTAVTTDQMLDNHYALCAAYQRKLNSKSQKRAEYVLELLRNTTPQASIQFSLPDQAKPWLRLTVPDRRENPQELEFVLVGRKHRSDASVYQFEISLAADQQPRLPLQLAAILRYDNEQLETAICTVKRKQPTKLFRITTACTTFQLWICLF